MLKCFSCNKQAGWEVSSKVHGESYACAKHLEGLIRFYDENSDEVYTSPIYVRSMTRRELPKPTELFSYFTPEPGDEEAVFYMTNRRPVKVYLEAWPLVARTHIALGGVVVVMGIRQFAPTCLMIYGGRATYSRKSLDYSIIYAGAILNDPANTKVAIDVLDYNPLNFCNVIEDVGVKLGVSAKERQRLINNLEPEPFELWE
jgi:hypothetical protein